MGSEYDVIFRIGKYFLTKEDTKKKKNHCGDREIKIKICKSNKDKSYSVIIGMGVTF